MQDEIWRNLVMATANANYFKLRAQRMHCLRFWLGLFAALFGTGALLGAVARDMPGWAWTAAGFVGSLATLLSAHLVSADGMSQCLHAAIAWQSAADDWQLAWTLNRDDAATLERLLRRSSEARKLFPELPENRAVADRAYTEAEMALGAVRA